METSNLVQNKMTLPPGMPKIRRFAVYGRRSSGKTCILTALGMFRITNPNGYSSLWISDHENCPDVSGASNVASDDPLLARFRGKQMLAEQIERLKRGELPTATELRHPLRLLYEFTKTETSVDATGDWTNDAATFFAELIDYSGELINPDNNAAFADTLMKHLEQCDGLLILAEATTTPEQSRRLYEHLELLNQVLPAVAERRRKQNADPFPIALLLNKWDRMLDPNELPPLIRDAARPDLPESERQRTRKDIERILHDSLDTFFGQSPAVPQLTLATQLEALAGGKSYFRTFCVSALGPCRTESRPEGEPAEKPVQIHPLNSFGLEDPFIWLSQLADKLALQRLEDRAASLRPWHLQTLVNGALPDLWKRERRLTQLYPDTHRFSSRLATVRRKLLQGVCGLAATAASLTCLVTGAGILSTTAFLDSRQWEQFGPMLDTVDAQAADPKTKAGLAEAEAWIGGYSFPTWRRSLSYLLVKSQEDAVAFHADLKERIGDIESQERLIARVVGLEARAKEIKDAGILSTICDEIRNISVPDGFAAAASRRQEAIDVVDNRLMLIKFGDEYLRRQGELDRLLQVGAVLDASREVANCTDQSQRAQLQARFAAQAPKIMSAEVRKLLDRSEPDFSAAADLVTNYRSQLREHLSTDLLEKLCGIWEQYHSELLDYHFYSRCINDPQNRNTLNEYLAQTQNNGFRVPVVQKQLEYLDWMEKPCDWDVEVSRLTINYHSNNAFNNPDVTAMLKTEAATLSSRKIEDLPAGTSITGLSGRLANLPPSTSQTIKVSFLVEYGLFGTYENNLGEYVLNGQLAELAGSEPIRVSVRGGDADAASNVVEIAIRPSSTIAMPRVQLDPAGSPPELADEELL